MADTQRESAPSRRPTTSDGWTTEAISALANELFELEKLDLYSFVNYLCGYSPATVNVAFRAWKPYYAAHNERYGKPRT